MERRRRTRNRAEERISESSSGSGGERRRHRTQKGEDDVDNHHDNSSVRSGRNNAAKSALKSVWSNIRSGLTNSLSHNASALAAEEEERSSSSRALVPFNDSPESLRRRQRRRDKDLDALFRKYLHDNRSGGDSPVVQPKSKKGNKDSRIPPPPVPRRRSSKAATEGSSKSNSSSSASSDGKGRHNLLSEAVRAITQQQQQRQMGDGKTKLQHQQQQQHRSRKLSSTAASTTTPKGKRLPPADKVPSSLQHQHSRRRSRSRPRKKSIEVDSKRIFDLDDRLIGRRRSHSDIFSSTPDRIRDRRKTVIYSPPSPTERPQGDLRIAEEEEEDDVPLLQRTSPRLSGVASVASPSPSSKLDADFSSLARVKIRGLHRQCEAERRQGELLQAVLASTSPKEGPTAATLVRPDALGEEIVSRVSGLRGLLAEAAGYLDAIETFTHLLNGKLKRNNGENKQKQTGGNLYLDESGGGVVFTPLTLQRAMATLSSTMLLMQNARECLGLAEGAEGGSDVEEQVRFPKRRGEAGLPTTDV